jgi:DNA-binding transcriptional ArsR family regulator
VAAPPARAATSPAQTTTTAAEAVLDALGDPTRRRILALLAAAELPVSSLTAALGTLSQPAVSQHLRVLRDAGLLTVRADGTRRLHRLDPAGVAAAQGWLAALLDPLAGLAQPLDALATEVARGRRARRTTSDPRRSTA